MSIQVEDIKQIHIKLTTKLHQALKLEAAYSNATIQELVVELIRHRITESKFSTLIKEVEE